MLKVNFDRLHLSSLESCVRRNFCFVDRWNEFDVHFAGAADVCLRQLGNLYARLSILNYDVAPDVRLSLFSSGEDSIHSGRFNCVSPN